MRFALTLALVLIGCKDDTDVEGSDTDSTDSAHSHTEPSDGPFFMGVGSRGGEADGGGVFRADADAGTTSAETSFEGTPFLDSFSSIPHGFTAHPSNGKLYGFLPSGGAYNGGAMVELDPSSGDLRTLYSFDDPTEGAQPMFAPTFLDADNVVGTTRVGGAADEGTLFKINLSSLEGEVLVAFDSTTGQNNAQLFVDQNGDVWGQTSSGDNRTFRLEMDKAPGADNPVVHAQAKDGNRSFAKRGSYVFGAMGLRNGAADLSPWYWDTTHKGGDPDDMVLVSTISWSPENPSNECANPIGAFGSSPSLRCATGDATGRARARSSSSRRRRSSRTTCSCGMSSTTRTAWGRPGCPTTAKARCTASRPARPSG